MLTNRDEKSTYFIRGRVGGGDSTLSKNKHPCKIQGRKYVSMAFKIN